MMGKVLKGLVFAHYHINDVIIVNDVPEEHVKHLQTVFKQLQKWGLHLHHENSKIFHDLLPYLGHMIVLGRLGAQKAKECGL